MQNEAKSQKRKDLQKSMKYQLSRIFAKIVNSKSLFNESNRVNIYDNFMLLANDYSTINIGCGITSKLMELIEIELIDSSKYSDCIPA